MKCNKCGYIWDTKSKLKMVTCPSCLVKVKVEEAEELEIEII